MRRTAAVLLSAVLVCALALLWDLPPPVAGDPVELMAWIPSSNHVEQGATVAATPAAKNDTVMQIKPRENSRAEGAKWTTRATGDWILPPERRTMGGCR